MFNKAVCGIRQGTDAAKTMSFRSVHQRHLCADQCFNGQLLFIRQLVAIAIDELNTIVLKGIVGGADYGSKRSLGLDREQSHCWRRNNASKNDINTSRTKTRSECRFQHLSRPTSITTNDATWTVSVLARTFAQNLRGGLTETHDKLR